MNLRNIVLPRGNTVLGLDTSTNSLAFAKFDREKPIVCGEVKFNGPTVFDRLYDAKIKTAALVESGILRADYVAIESAIMVRNIQVAIDLAYVYGAIIGELMVGNPEVHKIPPITWQSGIGNPNLKKAEKDQIRADNPGKSDSWYKARGREIRKQKTLSIARQWFAIDDGSDNVGDAVGIALYASRTLTVPRDA